MTMHPSILAALMLLAGCQSLSQGVQVDRPAGDPQHSAPVAERVDEPPGTPSPTPPSPLTVDALYAVAQAAVHDWVGKVPCVGEFPLPVPKLNCHLTRHLAALRTPSPHLAFMMDELAGAWDSETLPAPLVTFRLVDAGGRQEPDSARPWVYFQVAIGLAADGTGAIEIDERTSEGWFDVDTRPFEMPAGVLHDAAQAVWGMHRIRSGQATHALPLDRSTFLAVEVQATGTGEAARIEAAAARHLAVAQKCHRTGPVAAKLVSLHFKVSPAGRLTTPKMSKGAPGHLQKCLVRGLAQVQLSPADAGSGVSFFFFVRPAARPEIKVVEVVAGGHLLQAEAEAALAAPVAVAQTCFQAAAERHPRLEGAAMVRLVVGAGGEVETARFEGGGLKPLATCVEAAFRAARFPVRADSSRIAASLAFHNPTTSSMKVAEKSM